MRLRGVQPSRDDSFQFLLESLFLDLPVFENCEEDTITARLDIAHAQLIENFKNCLNPNYYQRLEIGE